MWRVSFIAFGAFLVHEDFSTWREAFAFKRRFFLENLEELRIVKLPDPEIRW